MYVYLYYFELLFTTAGDISGAVQTLRTLLLFYPSDKDSLDNLQLYSETLGGATEAQGTQPKQVTLSGHGIKFTTKAVIMPNHNIHGDYDLLAFSHAPHTFVWICLAGDCQLHQSVFAGEETALFWHGEP